MPFPAPTLAANHPDRARACAEAFELALMKLIDGAVTVGWRAPECFDAIEEVIHNQRLAYAEDPDPLDAPDETDPQPRYDGPIGTPREAAPRPRSASGWKSSR